jgi:hypothetical protein
MNYNFQIFKNKKLIITDYKGVIHLEDIKRNMTKMSQHPNYSPNYSVINDFSNCKLELDHDDVAEYLEFIENDLQIIASRKVALIANEVNEVVLSMLFSSLSYEYHIVSKTFRYFENALFWLGVADNELVAKCRNFD